MKSDAELQAERDAQHLAAIVASSDDAIITTDMNGVVISWNRGAESMFGYSAVEMVGAPMLRLFPPDRMAEEQNILRALQRNEILVLNETQRLTKDRQAVDVSIVVSPIRNQAGDVTCGSRIMRDISLLKAREREMLRMSRLYSALSQINQAIVWSKNKDELLQKVCDVLVDFGHFRMVWVGWNDPQTHRLYPVAVTREGRAFVEQVEVYSDDRPEGRGACGTAFRSNRPYIANCLQSDPIFQPWREKMVQAGYQACAMFPVRMHGEVCAVLSVYADQMDFFQSAEVALLEEAAGDISFALDKFAQAEAVLQANALASDEKHFSQSLIESMPGILYFYNEEGHFLRWNRAFEQVSGYSGEELARMNPLDFFGEADKPLLQSKIAEVFETGTGIVEADFLTRSGASIPYLFTGRRVEFNGEPCLVGIGIDNTQRRAAEIALREMNETLEHRVADRTRELQSALVRAESADRLKSAFLATMSHELRTPLNSIIGFTGVLLQGLAGELNPEQQKQMGMVQGSARHLLELINDVLDISKIESGQMELHAERFDLQDSLERVVASVHAMAEKKGLVLRVELAANRVQMNSDRRRIEQVLLNLLNNAIKFTDHGEVVLTVEQPDEQTGSAQPWVRLRVKDTGMGIRAHDMDKLFKPFRQLDSGLTRQHEGTGLGLAICSRLVEALQGSLTVQSEWGKGSEFSVTLPLVLDCK